jgi:hypothetical protein
MCPACFGMFKLTPKTKHGSDKSMPGMVLHGYKRPGTGYIDGNCFGQDWPPFELSPEGTKAWLKKLEVTEKNHKDYVARLKAGDIDTFGDRRDVRKTWRKQEMDPREWEKLLRDRTAEAERTLGMIEVECNRLRRAIASWKPEPLGP